MYQNTRAFTLIELLVVVLIIGILAAVAVPQYKFAVAKARLTQLVTAAQSIKQAEERYYLANGEYTTDWTALDIDFTGTWNANDKLFGSKGWAAQFSKYWVSVWHKHIPGLRLYYSWGTAGTCSCYALAENAQANELCKFITKHSSNGVDGAWNIYSWQ